MSESWARYPHSASDNELPSRLAGFWLRFGGILIDGIIVSVISYILEKIVGSGAGASLSFIVAAAYYIYLIGRPQGQSVGDMVMQIRVIPKNSDGPVGYGKSTVRFLMSYISAIVFLLGFFWMIWDPQKQTWHDRVADTLVVTVTS